MALIKLGGLAQEARGSLNGTVFSRNTYGAYVRNRTKPVNPSSPRQVAARDRVRQLQTYWRATLSQADRLAWANASQATNRINRLGDVIKLSPVAAFLACNTLRLASSQAVLATPPAPPLITQLPDITLEAVVASGLNVTAISPAPVLGDYIFFQVSAKRPRTVNFFKGPWYQFIAAAAPLVVPYLLVGIGDVALQDRFFVQLRVLNAAGQISTQGVFRADCTS
jgi:hypothetical protein